jgi:hypothetical protein
MEKILVKMEKILVRMEKVEKMEKILVILDKITVTILTGRLIMIDDGLLASLAMLKSEILNFN